MRINGLNASFFSTSFLRLPDVKLLYQSYFIYYIFNTFIYKGSVKIFKVTNKIDERKLDHKRFSFENYEK